ncbi:DUF1993 domain-containing protein [Nostoc sp. 3335mG]|nr:DUF1993 domain-containing protein [Nostoc sp. 3335mG]
MALSLYDASIPLFIRGFASLSAILEKGRAFADQQGLPHSDLLDARLIEDMAPLTAQVQRCSDTSKNMAVRVGRIPSVAMPDTESSFDELQARIAVTVAFLEAVPADSFEGQDDATILLPTPHGDIAFTPQSYVLTFAVPNFFFHLTTAYALLRMKGVPIGKLDYLGGSR